tara:strand:- start:12805 stop:13233 length:429 start_codon:yes stop_codon:yes gene_type:complete
MYKKIEISKTNDNSALLYYESDNIKIEKKLDEDEYLKIFEKFNPNIGFSLPDVLVQNYIKDGTIIPSFKRSDLFTNDDFDKLIEPFRNNYVLKKRQNKRKKVNKFIRKKTKKKPGIKKKLLKKQAKLKNNASNNKKTQKKNK